MMNGGIIMYSMMCVSKNAFKEFKSLSVKTKIPLCDLFYKIILRYYNKD